MGGPEATSVSLRTPLTPEQLYTLVPPAIRCSRSGNRTEVVQATRVEMRGTAGLVHAVESRLVPWLEPELVFVQTPTLLLIWVVLGAVDEVRGPLRSIIGLQDAKLDEAVRGARPVAAPAAAADPAGYGAMPPATSAEEGPAYVRLALQIDLHRGQLKGLEHFRSQRGIAASRRLASLRVHADGQACLVLSNCEPTVSALGEGGEPGKGGGGKGGGAAGRRRSAGGAALSAGGRALLASLLGEGAQCRVQPGQGGAHQTLRFEAEAEGGGAEGGGAQGELDPRQPPLIEDRPWGVRLLCLVAAGQRDRTLRVAVHPEAAREAEQAVLTVPIGVPEGLEWSLAPSGRADEERPAEVWELEPVLSAGECEPEPSRALAGARVLLPRHCLLKVALPRMEEAARLWAVGSTTMHLGDGQSKMVAVDAATLLPAGAEWIGTVLRACGLRPPEGAAALPSGLAAAADEVAALQPGHELQTDPEAVAARVEALRRALEPWLNGEEAEPEVAGAEERADGEEPTTAAGAGGRREQRAPGKRTRPEAHAAVTRPVLAEAAEGTPAEGTPAAYFEY